MAIKIHWGANGAYKTSGAIQDDAVPALLAGRVIVTNIRGFTLDRVYKVYPDLPETAQIINLDLDSLEELEKMRNWFTWAPLGAFIIFDEAQLVFPKSWREKDLENFDYPGGMEAAKEANRPYCWLDAWTRHRHFGFDIVLTTPNISYIRDDIRSTCETAYRHANLAVIGIRGRYKEAQHDAQLNRPPEQGSIIQYKRIKPETFRLYGSTSTGEVRDTFAGQSLFKSRKILVFMALVTIALYVAGSGFNSSRFFGSGRTQVDGAHDSSARLDSTPDRSADSSSVRLRSVDLSDKQGRSPGRVSHPFSGHEIKIIARLSSASKHSLFAFELKDENGRTFVQTSNQLLEVGYTISRASDCFAVLTFGLADIPVTCRGVLPGVNSQQTLQVASAPEPDEVKQIPVTVIPHVKNKHFSW